MADLEQLVAALQKADAAGDTAAATAIAAAIKQARGAQPSPMMKADPSEYDPSSPDFAAKYGPAGRPAQVAPDWLTPPEDGGMGNLPAPQEMKDYFASYAAKAPSLGQIAQNTRAAFGKFFTDQGLALRQILGMAPGSAARDKAALDAPLMATGAGKLGYGAAAVSEAAAAGMIPGANTFTGAALIGGAHGALRPANDNIDRAINAGGEAALAGVGQWVGNKIATNILAEPKTPRPAPTPTLGLGADDVTSAGDKIVTKVWKDARAKLGDDTPIPAQNTLQAVKDALDQVTKTGRRSRELTGILNANEAAGSIPVGTLDDIFGNMARNATNPKGVGSRQAQSILAAIEKDMNAAGQAAGVNFSQDLTAARAFSAMYRGDNLGRVVGQHGKALEAFQAANPEAYDEIAKDWAAKKLNSFIETNASGGRQVNTKAFASWVNENEKYLPKLVGQDTVDLWKKFPALEAKTRTLKGIVTGALRAKLGMFFPMVEKKIDSQFASTMIEALTDPASPFWAETINAPSIMPALAPTLDLERQSNAQKQRR